MTAVAKETRTLTLHPMAIYTFIKAQAGSLGKALSESVMNSIDAFAGIISIKLTTDGFVVEDDGQGFRGREEIAAWFETLGFPHDEGNHRMFGKFGMGRAQQWAYAKTVWYSNQFIMNVDIQAKGLDYDLQETRKPIKGTRIEGTFYNSLTFPQQQALIMELKQLLKYAPALVSLNGELLTHDPGMESWDVELPEAWIRIDKSRSTLDVYNSGVLVAHFPRYRFDCAGYVVTKPGKTLNLNLARNDILVASDPVWAKIEAKLKELTAKPEKAAKRVKPSAAQLRQAGERFTTGAQTLMETLNKTPDLLFGVNGRIIEPHKLLSPWFAQTVTVTPKGDDFGKRLVSLKRAIVIAKESLALLGMDSVEALRKRFMDELQASLDALPVATDSRRNYEREGTLSRITQLKESTWSDDPRTLFQDMFEGKTVFKTSELSLLGAIGRKCWVKALPVLKNALPGLDEGSDFKQLVRRLSGICAGDCPSQLAWLGDGNELVLRQHELAASIGKPLPEMMQYAMQVLEAFCNDLERRMTVSPGLFGRLVTQTPAVGRIALILVSNYVSACAEHGLPVPRTQLRELELAGLE